MEIKKSTITLTKPDHLTWEESFGILTKTINRLLDDGKPARLADVSPLTDLTYIIDALLEGLED